MALTQADLDNLLAKFKDFSATNNQDLLKKMSEEFQGKLDDLEKRLREEFMSKFAELEEKQNNNEGAPRGAKFQRTGTSGRRAASADGRMPRKQVVLLGFPKELRQPTLQRTAESVRHTIGHSGAAPKIKVYDFSKKVMFVFQSEAQAESFVERAEAHEMPFTCPISKEQVSLRVKIHIPAEERTHAKTVGALQNQIKKVRGDLDLASNGGRGDVFTRDGENGVKIFKVLEQIDNGIHKIVPNSEGLQKLGFDVQSINAIIAATHLEAQTPFRG